MSQIIQDKPDGNTITSGSKKPTSQLYRWFFTLKYEEISAIQLSQDLKSLCDEFCFSGEIGAGGYKHWQGCFSLKHKEYFNTVKNLFPCSIHLEGCKHWIKAKNYCKKIETHIEGPYDEKYSFLVLPLVLYKWQKFVEDKILENPDNRSILWFWDEEGCTGKTTLCKYLITKYNATFCGGGGSLKDIAFSIPENPRIVLFNITRTNEDHVNYGALEALKDGLVFSAKYESKAKVFNSPHVLIFANFEPKVETMTLDRWKVFNTQNI